ncbi:MAG: homoserine O-succinyltransferase [Alphaproteobacteria bacterium]
MPVIVNARDPHPFLPSLGDPAAIEAERARHQDIRPMEIAIINLMADKMATERQLAYWLGNTMLQVNLTFATTDSYVKDIHAGRASKNTPPEHIKKFYHAFSDIKDKKFDGLIVTGVNALKPTVGEEEIWPEVIKILDWSADNVLSSLFLCWGAKAALKYFHNIESYKGDRKTWGLFTHQLVSDKTGLLSGFPDRFQVPVSRWKSPRKADILDHPDLEIVAECNESGPNIMVESSPYDDGSLHYPKRVYVLNHPEYDTESLKTEYERDIAIDPAIAPPRHYFPGDNLAAKPLNTWRHTAHLYTNWIKAIYEATPYEMADIPQAFTQAA